MSFCLLCVWVYACVCSCVMIVWIMQRDCFKWIFKVRLVSLTHAPLHLADSTNHFPFASACHGSFHFLSFSFSSFPFFFCLLDAAFAYPPSCAICIFPAFFRCTLASSERGRIKGGIYIFYFLLTYSLVAKLKNALFNFY